MIWAIATTAGALAGLAVFTLRLWLRTRELSATIADNTREIGGWYEWKAYQYVAWQAQQAINRSHDRRVTQLEADDRAPFFAASSGGRPN